jgi:redox-sensitive bicupin YhaK (pirin superfamily)
MITLRKAQERGHFDHGWLNTYHTFSFADYFDPQHMGFRDLRVINEDFVQPGEGFGTHGHRDMEIVTYILDGTLQHKDSMKNGSVIRRGEVQRMSAGKGVLHSEFNNSQDQSVHLLQIWILPERKGIEPEYEQKKFPDEELQGKLRLVVSPDGNEGALRIHQDIRLYTGRLDRGKETSFDLRPGRHAWVQVASGKLSLNGKNLSAGDGAAVSDEQRLEIRVQEDAEVLVFDLK